MEHWDKTYSSGRQINNTKFPEQFLIKFFHDPNFQKSIQQKESPSILDIGCGYGRNVPLFMTVSQNITCLDPSQNAVDFIAKNYNVTASVFTPPNLGLDKAFDLIVACNSIYYIDEGFEFYSYVDNIINTLNDNGLFIFSLIGENHSILNNASKTGVNTFTIQNTASKFVDRAGQMIFVPDENFDPSSFGLSVISQGVICDDYDGDVRHLKVFLAQKNA